MNSTEIDLAGKTLGTYKVISQLGRGGMAVVYKAHESSLNRIVALKVLSSRLSQDSEYIKRFQREARAAAQLNHQNIVQIYAIGEEKGIHYFAMEYIKGISLSDLKKAEKIVAPEKAAPLIKQVAEALGEAHKVGLVHRDIKPSNIMIDAMGRPKVTDFGIAYISREQTRLTQEGSIIGTPEYLSPEQCEGKTVDGRSDIYSLGVTFYELLTGRTPYEADTPVSLLMKIVKGNFMPIAEANPDVPEPIRRIVEKMMHIDVKQRYANVYEVIKDIDKVEESLFGVKNMVMADPVAAPGQTVSRMQVGNRNKIRALGIAAVIVLLLGGAFAAKIFYFDKQAAQKTGEITAVSQPGEQQSPSAGDQGDQTAGPFGSGQQDAGQLEPLSADQPQPDQLGRVVDQPQPGQLGQDRLGDQPGEAGQIAVETETFTQDPGTAVTADTKSTGADQDSAVTGAAGKSSAQDVSPGQPGIQPGTQPDTSRAKQGRRPQQKRTAPAKALPPANSVLVTTLGDGDKVDFITSSIQSILGNDNFTVIDGPSINKDRISDIARYHLVTTVKHMGSTTLNYYGSTSELYTVGITIKIISPADGRIAAGPLTAAVKYTAINAEEKLREAIETLTFELRDILRSSR